MDPGESSASIASGALKVEILALGAELAAIRDSAGKDLLWNGDPAFWNGRAPILFPVIGMLRDGRYRFDGRDYEMPKHGFARRSVFEILPGTADAVTMRLDATPTTRAIYPFEFRLEVAFAVRASALRVTATIENRGDRPMPASFGFHPALRWPLPFGRPRAKHAIRFAQPEPAPVRRIDGDGFLTPTPHPTPVEGDRLPLRDDLFVDDALIFDRLASRSVRYGADSGPSIEVRFDDFATLGVWNQARRAVHLHRALARLSPTRSASMAIFATSLGSWKSPPVGRASCRCSWTSAQIGQRKNRTAIVI